MSQSQKLNIRSFSTDQSLNNQEKFLKDIFKDSQQEEDEVLSILNHSFSSSISKPKKSETFCIEDEIFRIQMPEPKTTCNCSRNNCLRLYCQCFKTLGYCSPSCGCINCFNTEDKEEVR